MSIVIKSAISEDFDGIWEIFSSVISTGDTYAYVPSTTKEEAYSLWMPPHKNTYIALIDHEIVGTYFIKPNQPGLGSHIANAAYMVHPKIHGAGIGKAMAEHSLKEAKQLGYKGMQFNLVISTNTPAVKLWQKMGFTIIGVSPKAYQHTTLGLVDAYIMHRFLD